MSDASEPGYEGHVVIVGIRNLDAPEGAGLLTLHFVHYPGSQQLTLWLPQSGYQSYGELSVMRGETVIERGPVRDRLNGSVQILFATLAWPPGDYTIVNQYGSWYSAASTILRAPKQPPAFHVSRNDIVSLMYGATSVALDCTRLPVTLGRSPAGAYVGDSSGTATEPTATNASTPAPSAATSSSDNPMIAPRAIRADA